MISANAKTSAESALRLAAKRVVEGDPNPLGAERTDRQEEKPAASASMLMTPEAKAEYRIRCSQSI